MSNRIHHPFKRVLVANRGEIAIRVFRALNELGITSVGIYSKEDKYATFRTKADESYPLRQDRGPIDAYLDIDTIITGIAVDTIPNDSPPIIIVAGPVLLISANFLVGL